MPYATFNPCTWAQKEVQADLQVQGQTGVQSKFHDRGTPEKLCLKKNRKTKQITKQSHFLIPSLVAFCFWETKRGGLQ